MTLDKNTYPTGKFENPTNITNNDIQNYIGEIEKLPETLLALKAKLNTNDLTKTYREGSWNVHQILHHIGDSHTNAYIRFKFALTEDNSAIKPYDQNKWVQLGDTINVDCQLAIDLIKAIHAKWVLLLKNMDPIDFDRTYFHPEYKKTTALKEALALYAWHGKHHAAQIEVAVGLR